MTKTRDILQPLGYSQAHETIERILQDRYEKTGGATTAPDSAMGQFWIAFCPEHVALMEDVIDAVRGLHFVGDNSFEANRLCMAERKLMDYRREHGLV